MVLLQIIRILLEHESDLGVQILWQLLFEELTDFLAMLAVTVGHRKEMAVFQPAEVRHRDPHILIYFVWVARRQSRLRCKCELGDCVCVHLLWIAGVVGVWLQVGGVDGLGRFLLVGLFGCRRRCLF